MKASTLRISLDVLSQRTGHAVFTAAALANTVMRGDSRRSVEKTLSAAVRNELLVRACRGIYVYPYAIRPDRPVREEIALVLRPRCFNYISLETALSWWGVIEQATLGAITLMSTGRSQQFDTPYGGIDITHTAKHPATVMADIVIPEPSECRLPYAGPRLAASDLRRVGRSLDLVNWDEIDEIEQERRA